MVIPKISTKKGLASFTYTGREFDSETGLYYYRARYYDPSNGRFTTQDPKGFGGGINFYVYVANNPVNYVDPLGLASLLFDSETGTLTLFNVSGIPVGRYQAHNNTNNNNPWPKGVWEFIINKSHPENPTSYGQLGIYIFDVTGHSGLGVHSGGSKGLNTPTKGCVRTSDQAMEDISNLSLYDPLLFINIK